MSNASKKWLAAGAVCLFVGAFVFFAGIAANGFDLSKLGTVEYGTVTHNVMGDFSDIAVKTNTANVVFLPSEDESCRVVAYEATNERHTVSVDGSTLTVSVTDTRKWYEYIGFSFTSPRITVYLPGESYGTLLLKTDTGDVNIPNAFSFDEVDVTGSTGNVTLAANADTVRIATSTGNVTLNGVTAGKLDVTTSTGNILMSSLTCCGEIKTQVSTGDMRLTDVTCKRLTSNGSTGDLYLKNVIAAEDFSIERDTGDVAFDRADAKEIFIETDTGDVTGTLLTKKLFFTHTDTGDVSVPRSESGGRCEISTDTGDIRIRIQE